MHATDIPEIIAARMGTTRGGRTHLAKGLDPATTALVVIDLQDGFMREGSLIEVPMARAIVDNVNRLSGALRAAGGKVSYTRYTYDPDEPKAWGAFFDRFLDPARSAAQKEVFAKGAPDHGLWAGLEVAAEDYVVDKTRYSAFTPGTCDFPAWLEENGIETVIVTGTLSNCCCESTARDAMQYGYDVIYVTDANATLTDAEHQATLCNMGTLFAELADTETLVEALAAEASPLAQAG